MDGLWEFHSQAILWEFHFHLMEWERNSDTMRWEFYSHALARELPWMRIDKVSIPKVCYGNFVPITDFVK